MEADEVSVVGRIVIVEPPGRVEVVPGSLTVVAELLAALDDAEEDEEEDAAVEEPAAGGTDTLPFRHASLDDG